MKEELIDYLAKNYPEEPAVDLLAKDVLAAHNNIAALELFCERLKLQRDYYKNLAEHHSTGGYYRNSHKGRSVKPPKPSMMDPVTDDWIETGREA